MKEKHHHDGQKDGSSADAKPSEEKKSGSLAGTLIKWFLALWLLKAIIPDDAGDMMRQFYVLMRNHYRPFFDLGAVLKNGLMIVVLVAAIVIIAMVCSKVLTMLRSRKPAAAKHVDVLGDLFGKPQALSEGSALVAGSTASKDVAGAEYEGGLARQAKALSVLPVLADDRACRRNSDSQHAASPLARNAAFVYAPRLRSFYLTLVAHDWTLEHSVDKSKQRRGASQRKLLEKAAAESDEHRALYDAYVRFMSGQTGDSGDSVSALPSMSTSGIKPLLVEDGLQEFFRQLEAHDWFFAQRSEPARTKGKLERRALETIACRTPQHMALFRAFRAHQYSGDAWGTPQQPAPLLRSGLNVPRRTRASSTSREVLEVSPASAAAPAIEEPSAHPTTDD